MLAFKKITCATAVAKMLTLIKNTLHSLLQLILTSRQLARQLLRTALPTHLRNLLTLTLRTKMSYLSNPGTKHGEMFLSYPFPTDNTPSLFHLKTIAAIYSLYACVRGGRYFA